MTPLRRRAAAVLLVLGALLAVAGLGERMATASAPAPCPPGTQCVTGKLLVRDPGSDTVHQVLVLDKNGAPMFAINVFGAFSYGEPVCSTGLDLRPLACLGGAQGSYGGQASVTLYLDGRPVTLTARDLLVLTRWAHAREARR